jgi:hypothetical protein
MQDDFIGEIIRGQSPEGAFPSALHIKGREFIDWNGFITALVLRAVSSLPDFSRRSDSRRLALDFLERCESSSLPGAFGFWPEGRRPGFISPLPADADDTSIITLELLKHDRIGLNRAREVALKRLLPHRLRQVRQPSPPWIRSGVFLTWLSSSSLNVVDCCVNANVVAMLAFLDLDNMPGFVEASGMIEDAVRWAGSSKYRFQLITPFYPDPQEMIYALIHAIDCGADQLGNALSILEQNEWLQKRPGEDSFKDLPVCGSAYGRIFWSSGLLQEVRRKVEFERSD